MLVQRDPSTLKGVDLAGAYLETDGGNTVTSVTAGGSPLSQAYIHAELNRAALPNHNVSLNVDNVSINLNELLLDMSIMRYQINNARMQPRYSDQLQARFGIYPEDARLDRPEYIGSSYINISTEGVTNTAGAIGTSAAQGKITSQAWGVSKDNKPLTYEVKEHGLIMTVFYVRPASVYDGVIPKQALASSRFDFPTPELANTPDVPILRRELAFLLPTDTYPDTQNDVIIGWTDIYSEYRTRLNKVCGLCRPSDSTGFKNNLARFWTHSAPPELNDDFICCSPDMARIKQYTAQPDFIYFVRQSVSTAQPLPIRSEPALLGNI